jgi:hypothetical protein
VVIDGMQYTKKLVFLYLPAIRGSGSRFSSCTDVVRRHCEELELGHQKRQVIGIWALAVINSML